MESSTEIGTRADSETVHATAWAVAVKPNSVLLLSRAKPLSTEVPPNQRINHIKERQESSPLPDFHVWPAGRKALTVATSTVTCHSRTNVTDRLSAVCQEFSSGRCAVKTKINSDLLQRLPFAVHDKAQSVRGQVVREHCVVAALCCLQAQKLMHDPSQSWQCPPYPAARRAYGPMFLIPRHRNLSKNGSAGCKRWECSPAKFLKAGPACLQARPGSSSCKVLNSKTMSSTGTQASMQSPCVDLCRGTSSIFRGLGSRTNIVGRQPCGIAPQEVGVKEVNVPWAQPVIDAAAASNNAMFSHHCGWHQSKKFMPWLNRPSTFCWTALPLVGVEPRANRNWNKNWNQNISWNNIDNM